MALKTRPKGIIMDVVPRSIMIITVRVKTAIKYHFMTPHARHPSLSLLTANKPSAVI